MSLKFLLVILTASVIVPGIVTSAKSHASDPSEDAFSTEEMSFLLFKTVNNTFLYDEWNASAFTEHYLHVTNWRSVDWLKLEPTTTKSG
jgi:hypothetical protein